MKLKDALTYSGGLLVQQVAAFVTGVVVARYLGPLDFGYATILKNLSAFVIVLMPLGTDLCLLKYGPLYSKSPKSFLALSLRCRLLVMTLGMALLVAVSSSLGSLLQRLFHAGADFANLAAITAVGLVFACDLQILGAVFRVVDRIAFFAVVTSYFQPIARLMLTGLAIRCGFGLEGVVIVNAACSVVCLGILQGSRAAGGCTHLLVAGAASAPPNLLAVATESIWMAFSMLFYQAMRFVDVLALGLLSGPAVTGEYSALSSVCQTIQIYPLAVSQMLGPTISRLYDERDYAGIVQEFHIYLRRASLIGGYIFGGVATFGVDLDLIFGPSYHFALAVTLLLATGCLLSSALAPLGYVLSMTGRHKQETFILAVGAATLCVLLRLLVPIGSQAGAATALLITVAAVNVVRSIYVINIIGNFPVRVWNIIPPLCCLLLGEAIRLVSLDVLSRSVLSLILSCTLYTIVSFLTYSTVFAQARARLHILTLARKVYTV